VLTSRRCAIGGFTQNSLRVADCAGSVCGGHLSPCAFQRSEDPISRGVYFTFEILTFGFFPINCGIANTGHAMRAFLGR
jgi:hypothetical protein